ncbi:hypothetical protein PVAP13_8KG272476 [Panicum virgatum]|uniref:Uncharacterized protein n=1 Tax=Panicum virgatum TaxID=38727 RepID=A0A8T0PMC0_PANVG|nr:hypothetical protein PVAP13_8KG272476 [Panicum virgatum]
MSHGYSKILQRSRRNKLSMRLVRLSSKEFLFFGSQGHARQGGDPVMVPCGKVCEADADFVPEVVHCLNQTTFCKVIIIDIIICRLICRRP